MKLPLPWWCLQVCTLITLPFCKNYPLTVVICKWLPRHEGRIIQWFIITLTVSSHVMQERNAFMSKHNSSVDTIALLTYWHSKLHVEVGVQNNRQEGMVGRTWENWDFFQKRTQPRVPTFLLFLFPICTIVACICILED